MSPLQYRKARLVPAILLAAGCSDGAGPNGDPVGVTVSFATRVDVASLGTITATSQADPITLNDGTNELVISEIDVVLEGVEFEGSEGVCDDDDDDGCDEFESGPQLIALPPDLSTVSITVPAMPGMYDEVELEIEPVEGDEPEEQEFLAEHPDFEGITIRVQGTFNGEDYVFTSDVEVERELEFDTPIEVSEASPNAEIMIMVDVASWFVGDNDQLIDPRTATRGEPNARAVARAIQRSFGAFDDDDDDDDDD